MKSAFIMFGLAVANENPLFKNVEEANNFLRIKRSTGWFDATTGAPGSKTDATTQDYHEQQEAQAEQFIKQYHLTSVESWDELKERLEANANIPKNKVDELENCVSSCNWENRKEFFRPGDRSIGEKKQNQENCYEKSDAKDESCFAEKLIPCPKCFRYIPTEDVDLIKEGCDLLGGGLLCKFLP